MFRSLPRVSADIAVGSLIKNIGGGIDPTGGYIAGSAENRTKSPVGLQRRESAAEGRVICRRISAFSRIVFGSQAVAQALTGAVFTAASRNAVTKVSQADEERSCIIQTVHFGCADEACCLYQKHTGVFFLRWESNVVPEPWDMPGYRDQVIMAAGTFVQGASIELSADAPIRSRT